MTSDARGGWRTSAWRRGMWGAIAALLLVPLVAMRFTDQVAWTVFDFAAAAAILVTAGGACEFVARHEPDRRRRRLIGAAILACVAALWVEGAAGIFD